MVENYYSEIGETDGAARAAALLTAVIAKAARLAARWMAAGFVHGVLNTDNMNINGESFDYGPYRFLTKNDPNFTAAYFDHSGLYAFGRQPEAVFWNLQQLAGCFVLVAEQANLIDALNGFAAAYYRELAVAVLTRLGVQPQNPDANIELTRAAFSALAEGGEALRWEPFFFDWFGGAASEKRALSGPRAKLYGAEAFIGFRDKLAAFNPERPERLASAYFAKPDPQELLYDEIEAIWTAIAVTNDWNLFNAKLAALEQARFATQDQGC